MTSRSRRLRAAFTQHLGLKATSLVIALLVWFVVGARRPMESYVPVEVQPVLDSSLVLRDGPPRLRALVAGRAADLIKLRGAPLIIRRTIDADAPDTLVLDVAPGDVHVPPELASELRVVDLEPHSVALRFETGASRRVPVVNAGRVTVQGDSTRSARLRFEPETVRITGPRRIVGHLTNVRPVPLALAAGDTMTHITDLDTTGLGVRVSPVQVRVRIHDRRPARGTATP